MRRLLILVCALSSMGFVTGCKSSIDYAKEAAKEALSEVGPVLKDAGKDLAAEARTQAALLAKDLMAQAVRAWAENKGDLQATIKATLATIPGLAAEAGKGAASEALAKRIEALEGKPKADEFRKRAADDGIQDALTWAGGGTTLGALLYALRLLRQRSALTGALATAPPEARAAVLANASAHPLVERIAGNRS